MLELSKFEVGPQGVTIGFGNGNGNANSRALNSRRNDQIGMENSANQNEIDTNQNTPVIEEIPAEEIPALEKNQE